VSSQAVSTLLRAVQRLVALFVAVIGLLTGTTATATAASIARPASLLRLGPVFVSETRVGVAADLGPVFVGLPPSIVAGQVGEKCPRFLTIVSGSCVATNTATGLGDDFTRALDDIDNGLPRPNVRDPKPFGNDGRGGTTRLPDADGAGNPISYTEHTVNPRPPGGTLDGSRVVVGSDGSVWATTDHFGTWTKVR
jgi:hypothetical protein